MTGDWLQTISCRDFAHRQRDLQVLIGEQHIIVRPPPGEVIRLGLDEAEFLRDALADAQAEARKRWRW